MALTKNDISQIKGIVHDEVENLARIVAKGFQGVDERFEQIDKRFELLDKRMEEMNAEIRHINARLDVIEHDISAIHKHLVYRDEFEEVLERLAVLEKKVGIRKPSPLTSGRYTPRQSSAGDNPAPRAQGIPKGQGKSSARVS